MLIAHLPAGYLASRFLINYKQKSAKLSKQEQKSCLLASLLGSVTPDFDLILWIGGNSKYYFTHHLCPTHLPVYWFGMVLMFLLLRVFNKKIFPYWLNCFFINVFIHLILDTVVGRIKWLYPLSNEWHYLFTVPIIPRFKSEPALSLFFHWTIVFEIAIIVSAICIYCKNRNG